MKTHMDIMFTIGEEVVVANGYKGEIQRISISACGCRYEVGYWHESTWHEVWLPASQLDRLED